MRDFLQVLLVGIGDGAIYAMLGLGLVVIYRSTGVLNFAQGELAMFSTFLVWTIWDVGAPMWLAVLLGMVGGFIVGALVHEAFVRPVGDPHQKPLAVVIVTIGLFLGINGLAQVIWGATDKVLEPLFGSSQITIAGVAIQWQKIGAVASLAAVAFVFYILFQKTKLGLAMRAVASNSESAGLVGIPVLRLLMLGWGFAAAVGTLAGVLTAPSLGLSPRLMQLTLIFAFAAITLGGFDSLIGAIVGGLTVGILSSTLPRYVSAFEKMPLAPAFILILLVLLIRPQGLFGSKDVSRV
ncbi:MAG: branched-chain amino acid ABC transporter permease [Microthrixaceae bacterium]|nr:branched-chain amino acid ABC transporter permease [Microthrixaceae bacterium]